MKNQTISFQNQSFRFAKKMSKNPYDGFRLFQKFFLFFSKKKISNMLDVGCGNGDFLKNFCKNKKISKVGVEPCQLTINLCKKRHKKIIFKKAFNHDLPFKDNKFDLVISFAVIEWIDRNLILQSLGELIRVTNKYLLIMDFYPKIEHKTKYKYQKGFFTFKTHFDKILESSGLLKKVFELNYFIDPRKNKIVIRNNSKDNIHSRKLIIYKKIDNLPLIKYKID